MNANTVDALKSNQMATGVKTVPKKVVSIAGHIIGNNESCFMSNFHINLLF